MRRRAFLASSAAALGGTGLLVGTQSFSAVEAEREVNIDVVGDEEAFLQLQYSSQDVGCNGEFQLVEIGNRTATEITSLVVTVESIPSGIDLHRQGTGTLISPGDEIVIVDENADPLSPGNQRQVELSTGAGKSCNGSHDVEFGVTASGPGIYIETTEPRAVTITCDCSGDLDVQFQQNGNVVNFGTTLSETVTAWYVDGSDIGSEEVTVSGKKQITDGNLDRSGNVELIATEFAETDPETLFISPYWDGSDLSNGFDGACEKSKHDIGAIAAFLADGNNFPVCTEA